MGTEKLVKYPRGEPMTVGEYWAYLRLYDAAKLFSTRFFFTLFGSCLLGWARNDEPFNFTYVALLVISNLVIALMVRHRLREALPDDPPARAYIPILWCLVPFGTVFYGQRIEKMVEKRFQRAGVRTSVLSLKGSREAGLQDVIRPFYGEIDFREPPEAR